jgi:ParB family transcriptional regulator, chromosome partitioning protein
MGDDEKVIYEAGKVHELPIKDIKKNTNQPRRIFDSDELERLTESIGAKGVLVPILFSQEESGQISLIAGERRLRAAKEADLKTIPGILTEGDSAEIALIENVLRDDLSAVEKAMAMKELKEKQNYTQETLALFVKKGRSTVAEYLSVADLPKKILKECFKDKKYALRRLKKIATIKDAKEQEQAFKEYTENTKPGPKKDEEYPKHGAIIRAMAKVKYSLNKAKEKEAEKWEDGDKALLKKEIEEIEALIEELIG